MDKGCTNLVPRLAHVCEYCLITYGPWAVLFTFCCYGYVNHISTNEMHSQQNDYYDLVQITKSRRIQTISPGTIFHICELAISWRLGLYLN